MDINAKSKIKYAKSAIQSYKSTLKSFAKNTFKSSIIEAPICSFTTEYEKAFEKLFA